MRAALLSLMWMACVACHGVDPADCVPTTQPGGAPSGLERCGTKVYNRVDALPISADVIIVCDGGTPETSCSEACLGDERCLRGYSGCNCSTSCSSDDDCAADEACIGEVQIDGQGIEELPSPPRCLPASCRSTDDCDGGACAVQLSYCGGAVGLSCRSPLDCVDNDDCAFGASCVAKEGGTGSECSFQFSTTCE